MKEFAIFATVAALSHGLAFAYGLSLGLSTVRKWRRDWAWVEVETPADVRAQMSSAIIDHESADWLL